ncbi:MAG: DNA repair protein RecO [Pseudomonadota bacterium]
MEWHDNGFILSVRQHGENNAIAEIFTEHHGRGLGLVHGGRSRKKRPMLQPGNYVEATWRARLAEHLGTFNLELHKAYASYLLDSSKALAALNTLNFLAQLLPEREPHPGLYKGYRLILEHIENVEIWPSLLVRWEFELLNELGFGLDFSKCAATGETENLIYVSPKSGCAVSADAGLPYHDKLLKLPGFLNCQGSDNGEMSDVMDGFQLTGFFLEKYILQPRGLKAPEQRDRLISYLKKVG